MLTAGQRRAAANPPSGLAGGLLGLLGLLAAGWQPGVIPRDAVVVVGRGRRGRAAGSELRAAASLPAARPGVRRALSRFSPRLIRNVSPGAP